EAPEFRRLLRVPPAAANDDALGHDLAVADQMLADGVDIVELALLDRDEGGISRTSRLEAAEFRTPQRHRRIDRRGGDHIGERQGLHGRSTSPSINHRGKKVVNASSGKATS